MASSSGNSAPSGEDMIDQKKRKRMLSNRESARKSRIRKQKHVDDLTAQINQMKKDNAQMLATVKISKPQFVNLEAENCVLRAQMNELSQRLNYLNEIINLVNTNNTTNGLFEFDNQHDYMNDHWNMMYVNNLQPIMAAAGENGLYF